MVKQQKLSATIYNTELGGGGRGDWSQGLCLANIVRLDERLLSVFFLDELSDCIYLLKFVQTDHPSLLRIWPPKWSVEYANVFYI